MPHPVPPLPARRALALVALAVVAAPVPARAQLRAAWEAAATAARPLSGTAEAGQRLGTLLRYDRPGLALAGEGTFERTDRAASAQGTLSALLSTPSVYGWRATVAGEARWNDGTGPAQLRPSLLGAAPGRLAHARQAGALEGRVAYRRGATGAWLGIDAVGETGRPDGGAVAGATGRTDWLRPNAGLWRQFGGAVVSVQLGRREHRVDGRASTLRTDSTWALKWDSSGMRPGTADTAVLRRVMVVTESGDPGSPSFFRRWSEVETRLAWARGRLAFDGRLGARPTVGDRRAAAWGGAHATVALAPRLALIAGGGYEPTDVRRATVPRRYAALGLRVTPAALLRPSLPVAVRPEATGALDVRRVSPEEVQLVLRVPGARTVELSGDFTGWRPVAMRALGADRWEAIVRLAPGTHHCNVRIDGDAWVAPPGTTVVDDGFDGRVGLLVAP
ncbi:glycogen-binding domain-containing protein [Roseisolibacter sp. H3M3-2]|uniref:glycogen-binding domain-containing protein n=1 Tax=Roseisolibacter sp. H3M3-2 TaxID=3031323 RepID=UPI0023DB9C6C|nr:glycogen-binding domain-containing protein [Roseisolibacter sp. H3M3-2]MDF1505141.1 glycogen-binding domain-containing protein [Roseisolibacter sp. H3M3-2]